MPGITSVNPENLRDDGSPARRAGNDAKPMAGFSFTMKRSL
jgi:hypothetical protein